MGLEFLLPALPAGSVSRCVLSNQSIRVAAINPGAPPP